MDLRIGIETAYKRVGKEDIEADQRSKLQSAHGNRGANKLLDEEDMIDEREMRRAQNRLKRRDYEDLLEYNEDDADLFDDPMDKYSQMIKEAPSEQEESKYR
jgi:hypothetical protein